ncbi:MAG: hypothetical protein WCX46_04355 [Candidatus Paceibacterota bacterium]
MKQHTAYGIGKTHKSQCTKPDYQDGLCKEHFNKRNLKRTPWGQRPGYRQATMEDLLSGRSMKSKNTNQHILFSYRRGVINRFFAKSNGWCPTSLTIDPEPFCVTIL